MNIKCFSELDMIKCLYCGTAFAHAPSIKNTPFKFKFAMLNFYAFLL